MADSRPIVVEQPTERAQAFLCLADDHLDVAYRLARAILRNPTEAQDATHVNCLNPTTTLATQLLAERSRSPDWCAGAPTTLQRGVIS